MLHHPVDPPLRRPLRIFAFDPMHGKGRLSTVTVEVDNEPLTPGPCGSRIEVVDYNASLDRYYPPVDLDDRSILMQSGLAPAEADPRFHQQMVYAVASKVLENFDRALGRRVTFKGSRPLRLFPHALRDPNAFFDPKLGAVCFGYFTADREHPGDNLPGQTVFTCLSQDIIAHEVTHAIVYRLREFFLEPTNDDVLAFHEGFADIVAIFQHFTFPDVLTDAIASTRGNLHSSKSLVDLASQFGHATGKGDALRTALGQRSPRGYQEATEPHERGSILVAAVFDAFFARYQDRIRPLVRVASQGSGILAEGELLPDLVAQLSREAARAAQEVLTMCIRAFEYLPPVDLTFGDYLRALVTADYDLVADQNVEGRRALIEAFRCRGIFPERVISLSEDALRWTPAASIPPMPGAAVAQRIYNGAQAFRPRNAGAADIDPDERSGAWNDLRLWAKANAKALQLDPDVRIDPLGFHATYRVKPNGELVIEVTAQFSQKVNTVGDPAYGGLPRRGGTTVIAGTDGTVRFVIAKPLASEARVARQLAYVAARDLADPALAWADERSLARRARSGFRSLHRGLAG
jgi:hypothetical protein